MKLKEPLSAVSDQITTEVHYGVHNLKIQEVIACQDNEVKCMTIKDGVLYVELYLDVVIPGEDHYESIRDPRSNW